MKIPAKLTVVALSLLWGSEWLFQLPGENGLAALPHFRVLALRYFVAAIVLIPWVIRRKTKPKTSIPLRANVLLGVMLMALPTLYLAYRTDLSPGLVVIVFGTIPLVASLIASMMESSSGFSAAPALLGGLAGTAFLVRGSLSSSTSQAVSLIGLIAIVVGIAAALVKGKQWLRHADLPASVMVQMLTAGIIFATYSAVFERIPTLAWSGSQIAALVILGTAWSAAAYCVFYAALRSLLASQAAVVQWLLPAVGIAETAIRFRHLPEWGSLAGGLLAIASAFALLYGPKQGDTPLTLQITGTPEGGNAQS